MIGEDQKLQADRAAVARHFVGAAPAVDRLVWTCRRPDTELSGGGSNALDRRSGLGES